MEPIGVAWVFFIREQLFSARCEILGWSRAQSRAEQNQSAKQGGSLSHEVEIYWQVRASSNGFAKTRSGGLQTAVLLEVRALQFLRLPPISTSVESIDLTVPMSAG
jgi:hypothetical protein